MGWTDGAGVANGYRTWWSTGEDGALQLAAGFRLGGEVDAACDAGIETILAGISAGASPSSG